MGLKLLSLLVVICIQLCALMSHIRGVININKESQNNIRFYEQASKASNKEQTVIENIKTFSEDRFDTILATNTIHVDKQSRRYARSGEELHLNVMTDIEYQSMISDQLLLNFTGYLFKYCPKVYFGNITVMRSETLPHDGYNEICCFKCSVKNDCHNDRACCPHILSKRAYDDIDRTNYICEQPFMLANAADVSKFRDVYKYKYIMSCPNGTDPDEKELCESWSTQETVSMEVLPVTDRTLMVNYINNHCAACNGARTYSLWRPQIICLDTVLQSRDLTEIFEEVRGRDDCYLEFIPPTDVDVTPTICYTDIVNKCNTSGNWDLYDPIVEAACRRIHVHYKDSSKSDIVTYQNIFCALCNGVKISVSGCFNNARFQNSKFQYVLTNNFTKTPDDTDDENQCQPGKIQEPVTNTCKKLQCSLPLQLNMLDQTCSEVFASVNSGLYIVPVKVSYATPLPFSDVLAFTNQLRNQVESRLDAFSTCLQLNHKTNIPFANGTSIDASKIHISESIFKVYIRTYMYKVSPSTNMNRIWDRLTFNFTSTFYFGTNTFHVIPGNLDSFRFVTKNDSKSLSWRTLIYTEMPRKPLKNRILVFKDSYDGSTTIVDESFDGLCHHWENTHSKMALTIYDISFLACPSFLYELNKTPLVRFTGGLLLGDRNITFDFGNFRSINESHVLICAAQVLQIPLSTLGHANTGKTVRNSYQPYLDLVVFMLVLVVNRSHLCIL